MGLRWGRATLGLFLFVLLAPAFSCALPCAAELSTALPLGMSRADFGTLMDLLTGSEPLKDAEAIIIHGSRTHFTYGYASVRDSDIDILPIFPTSVPPEAIFDRIEKMNALLRPFGEHLRYRVGDGLPVFLSLEYLLNANEKTLLNNGLPPDQAKQIWEAVAKKAQFEGWTRARLKHEYTQAIGVGGHIHREALVFLRPGPRSIDYLQRFVELGYVNIYFL